MEYLDIFKLSNETRIITTIEELRSLYLIGVTDGGSDSDDDAPTCIKGDVV